MTGSTSLFTFIASIPVALDILIDIISWKHQNFTYQYLDSRGLILCATLIPGSVIVDNKSYAFIVSFLNIVLVIAARNVLMGLKSTIWAKWSVNSFLGGLALYEILVPFARLSNIQSIQLIFVILASFPLAISLLIFLTKTKMLFNVVRVQPVSKDSVNSNDRNEMTAFGVTTSVFGILLLFVPLGYLTTDSVDFARYRTFLDLLNITILLVVGVLPGRLMCLRVAALSQAAEAKQSFVRYVRYCFL